MALKSSLSVTYFKATEKRWDGSGGRWKGRKRETRFNKCLKNQVKSSTLRLEKREGVTCPPRSELKNILILVFPILDLTQSPSAVIQKKHTRIFKKLEAPKYRKIPSTLIRLYVCIFRDRRKEIGLKCLSVTLTTPLSLHRKNMVPHVLEKKRVFDHFSSI